MAEIRMQRRTRHRGRTVFAILVLLALGCLSPAGLWPSGGKEPVEEPGTRDRDGGRARGGDAGVEAGGEAPRAWDEEPVLEDAVERAELAMQERRFDRAHAVLVAGPIPPEKRGYASWLDALALFHSGDREAALEVCRKAAPGAGPWTSKLLFLAADIHVDMRDFRSAEAILQKEAARLLSGERKTEIASVYIRYAEALSATAEPDQLDAPKPDFDAAYDFYAKTLNLETPSELAEEVRFRMARMRDRAGRTWEAVREYDTYLESFDPIRRSDGSSRSSASSSTAARDPGPNGDGFTGTHRAEARYRLADNLIRRGELGRARRELGDLIALLEAAAPHPDDPTLRGDLADPEAVSLWTRRAERRLPQAIGLPSPASDQDLEDGLTATRDFLDRYPDDPAAPTLAWHRVAALTSRGRVDRAIEAARSFIEQRDFTVAAGTEFDAEQAALLGDMGIEEPPDAQFAAIERRAVYLIGRLRFGQKKYTAAIEAFTEYTTRFPDGPDWTAAQAGIVDAQYQEGVDLLAAGELERARNKWEAFLTAHPLDGRSRRILFAFGQMDVHRGREAKSQGRRSEARDAFHSAIRGFQRLVTKYPDTQEAGLAQLRTGEILETELLDLQRALEAYRRLNWSIYSGDARARLAAMTEKELLLRTERVFGTDEQAAVRVDVRNVPTLRIAVFRLDMEEYFRKVHTIRNVESLDLALISPDTTWEMPLEGYRAYLPLSLDIPIPMTGPGVYAVHVSEESLEATTLLIRSDIDIIVKSSREQALVLAQNRRTGRPAPGARVLLTDGEQVLHEGRTGTDGVALVRPEGLGAAGRLGVFVERQGHVASNTVSHRGLGYGRGLAHKGYLYTDMPAYRPGQSVSLRGIIREVEDGAYFPPSGAVLACSVHDPAGRVIFEREVRLSDFGTFSETIPLGGGAARGEYTIRLVREEPARRYAGSFRVEDFVLPKVRLELEFDREVYFRGEEVTATFKVLTSFGAPRADTEIRYQPPDGRELTGRTDREGRLSIAFDTSSVAAAGPLPFRGRLIAEGVEVYGEAYLAARGYSASLSPGREVSLAGEPVELTVRTVSPVGTPVSRTLDLRIYRRERRDPDPLLQSIPWMAGDAVRTWAETSVRRQTVTTDSDGTARVSFTPSAGGTYVYRLVGSDRFGGSVTAQSASLVSGAEDALRLRVLADRQHYRVGERVELSVHSRMEGPRLALLTHEGDGIIRYRVQQLEAGTNPVRFEMDHVHFPNFSFQVAVMDGTELRSAGLPFTVERELLVEIEPEKPVFAPREAGTIHVRVRDHRGRPVEAEFSLAVVEEALYSRYPDTTENIVSFFQHGARRETEMTLESSCSFQYTPATRRVNRDILAEEERVAAKEEAPREDAADWAAEDEEAAAGGRAGAAAERSKSASEAEAPGASKAPPEPPEPRRREREPAGFWVMAVTSGSDGRAEVTLPVPERIGTYRITARGCTRETLVGQGQAAFVSRKPLFVEMKAPSSVREGDGLRFLCTVHSTGSYSGPWEATLSLTGGGEADVLSVSGYVEPGRSARAVFPAYTVPGGDARELAVRLDLTADGAHRDGLALDLPINPWGIAFTDRKAGTAESARSVSLELPPGKRYDDLALAVSVSLSVETALVELVLGSTPAPLRGTRAVSRDAAARGDRSAGMFFPSNEPSELLAAASLAEYLERRRDSDHTLLEVRGSMRALVAQITATQNADGGWAYGSGSSHVEVTTLAHWALAAAVSAGVHVDPDVLERGAGFLRNAFARLDLDDAERRAMILHSLARRGGAEFTFVNRLHRQRGTLSAAALAYTALALAELDRPVMGGDLLDILRRKGRTASDGTVYWPAGQNLPWTSSDVETTALVLLVFETLAPDASETAQATRWLLGRRRRGGIRPLKAKGVITTALAGSLAGEGRRSADFSVTMSVNGTQVATVTSRDLDRSITIDAPPGIVRAGENRVDLDYRGSGEYLFAAELTGFSADPDPSPPWKSPAIESRRIIHENLTYRGREIGASTMPITELEHGRLATVHIDLDGDTGDRYLVLEDALPSGASVLEGTIRGEHAYARVARDRILFYFRPDTRLYGVSYQLAGVTPGRYRVLPPLLADAVDPSDMVLGSAATLTLLAPGESAGERYRMNSGELYGLGSALFEDGHHGKALEYLERLFTDNPTYRQSQVARMLLWIRSSDGHYDAVRLVEYFEILKENDPDLFIPFEKILAVGRAYHDIGEYERAALVYRATVEASFLRDAPVGGALERAGEILGSLGFMARLWQEYPDSPPVVGTYFALAQQLYDWGQAGRTLRGRSAGGGAPEEAAPPEILARAEAMLWRFMSVYPSSPLLDDAAFSRVNLAMDREEFAKSVRLCRRYIRLYAGSDFHGSFRYMQALGFFYLLEYNEAIAAAREVASGKGEDQSLALYILGQIHHARGEPATAISYYRRVEHEFPDAREAAAYFERRDIALEEVSVFEPGEQVRLTLRYRNIERVSFQVYKVDLMKLYLKEKNLSRITGIRLSGIAPQLETELVVGDGRDYRDIRREMPLDLRQVGAYLVICRGDDLFTSGLVLITPLEIQVQEQASGRVRINVLDTEDEGYAGGVHVKVIGSENESFISGETDLRGVFVADGVRGVPTAIARRGRDRYAFYRGEGWVGPPEDDLEEPEAGQEDDRAPNYRSNTLRKQRELQEENRDNLDRIYEEEREGVQVQEAY